MFSGDESHKQDGERLFANLLPARREQARSREQHPAILPWPSNPLRFGPDAARPGILLGSVLAAGL